MKKHLPDREAENDIPSSGPYDGEATEEDLWFLPGPPEDKPDLLAPLPRGEPGEHDQIEAWEKAQGAQALHLAQVAARFGALDQRLRLAPKGCRHRLALMEASNLSWLTGDRVSVDRLGLWQALRISASGDDTQALQRAGWAFRHLSGGPGPEPDLARFLNRREVEGEDPLSDRVAAWNALMQAAVNLHPIVRACLAFHLWPLSGIGSEGDILEGGAVSLRISASDGQGGMLFVPVLTGGAGRLRGGGEPADKLRRWLQASEQGIIRAMRHLDQLERWEVTARDRVAGLSGRTPPRLIEALLGWPLVTAPMAEDLTGASRAAVQRNLAWFQAQGLVQELTGQGRFRMWRVATRSVSP
jgi:hypothetical protein